MIKDFSHDLTDTQQLVEEMVEQMMTSLANIRLARVMADTVGCNCWRHFIPSLLLAVAG